MKQGKQILGQIWQGLKFNPETEMASKKKWHLSTAMGYGFDLREDREGMYASGSLPKNNSKQASETQRL